MSCTAFEAGLERFVSGDLERAERQALERHLEECSGCRELLELARIAGEPVGTGVSQPPDELVAQVLVETTGSSCGAAEQLLCVFVDEDLDTEQSELVRGHLSDCGDCAALARVLVSLAEDLPTLVDIRPDRRFVAAVLAATLPAHVRLERWWRSSWPRWIRRPRFALEAAYVATLALVVIFATPVSPLEAMPRRAVEMVQSVPAAEIGSRWQRLGGAVGSRLEAAGTSEGARAVLGSWQQTLELGEKSVERSRAFAGAAADWTVEQIRTFWTQAASLLERADGDSAAADPDTDEETK